LHLAKDCLDFKKNLITSSYISPEMRAMDAAVKEAGLMFMCEMGLDPGIDHMTASELVYSIQKLAGQLTSFKSYCGGLIAPESDDNPWHYKFSWNPRNIITAGADGAHFMEHSEEKVLPYQQLFHNNPQIAVDGLGELAYYPNRDSLKYLSIYDLPNVQTFLRATLRHPDFCKGWHAIVRLGLTSMEDRVLTAGRTYSAWVADKTGFTGNGSLVEHVANILQVPANDTIMSMLQWLGLFGDERIASHDGTSGEVLLSLLLEKWQMKPQDKDIVVMQHEVEYLFRGKPVNLTTTMVLKGEDREFSAMAKTVGLPMGILARMIMANKISRLPSGVLIPNMPMIYKPVLRELTHHGIEFHEEVL
jgi:saccharopine dehydrogenase (NADP+, L-glutamate forming)